MGEIVLALLFGLLLGGKLPFGRKESPPAAPEKPQPIPKAKQPPKGKSVPYPSGDEPPKDKPAAPEKPSDKPKAEPVPQSYKPPGGWAPYISAWSVSRAKALLNQPGTLPTGSSITETEPGTGFLVKFRAETGQAHGDPNLARAVTAWRKT